MAEARDDAPELTEVHRFVNEWEKDASVDLRLGPHQGHVHPVILSDIIATRDRALDIA